MPTHAINWFEIQATDFERACAFYEEILGVTLRRLEFGGGLMGIFPTESDGVGGAVWYDDESAPSQDGTRVYLNCDGKLDEVLARVPAAGGQVAMPKTSVDQYGEIALILDTEGNLVGLHASPTE